ncbi:protein FAM32A-like [Simochromis diagramma]|uniref:protein FAM32A-like n=1 Tax=Simochromis diagramma TaxID=43689 RepID=UPI001A7EDF89|nr:protein FAM32A-like [Simochromis diagramma]
MWLYPKTRTGSQSCVLSPLLNDRYTYDCTPTHPTNVIVKYANDDSMVGLIEAENSSHCPSIFFCLSGTEAQGQQPKLYLDKRTPAQIAFDKMQAKRQMEQILNKASKTHKHRVEDYNLHLDNLTEHYDIPKVSWTK